MNQVFRVEINGVDVTDYIVDTTRISEAVGRFYNTAEFALADYGDIDGILFKDVQIFYGDRVFNGFVSLKTKASKLKYTVICRSHGAKLTEPFSPIENINEGVTTASALCAKYATEIGYTINYNIIDLDFAGSYEREGTRLTPLTTIANVLGADFYDTPTGIIIEENKPVGAEDISISENDYFDFASKSENIFNKGIGEIIISDRPNVTSDIVSENKITIDIFDDLSANVYTNPKGLVTNSKGITVDQVESTTEITESIEFTNEYFKKVKAPIKSINSVLLNGVEIFDYNFDDGHNVLYFSTPKRGTIDINYVGYYQKAQLKAELTPLGYFYAVDMYYLDQELHTQGIIEYPENGIVVGDMTIFTPSEMNIGKGFNVWIVGGSPRIELFADGEKFITLTNYENSPYVQTVDARLEPVAGTGGYTTTIYHDNPTIQLVTSYGVEIPYTTSVVDGKTVIEFTQYYARVRVTYSIDTMMFSIPKTQINGDILMKVENLNDRSFTEFDVDNIDWNDLSSLPCELNQFIPINVASEVGKEVGEVAGYNLQWDNPDGSATSASVRADGFIFVWVFMNGDYVIDASPLVNKAGFNINEPHRTATITLTVAVGY